MPEEIFILSVLAILCGSTLILGIVLVLFAYNRAKLKAHQEAGDAGMTASELRDLIQQAVEEATRPLMQRIDALQAAQEKHEPLALPERPRELLEEEPALHDPLAMEAPRRPRTRS